MTHNQKDGGPAFPSVMTQHPYRVEEGMSLRDYIAIEILPWSARIAEDDHKRYGDSRFPFEVTPKVGGIVAARAYALADAMLRIRGQVLSVNELCAPRSAGGRP